MTEGDVAIVATLLFLAFKDRLARTWGIYRKRYIMNPLHRFLPFTRNKRFK